MPLARRLSSWWAALSPPSCCCCCCPAVGILLPSLASRHCPGLALSGGTPQRSSARHAVGWAKGLLSRRLMRALICLPTYLMASAACALWPIPPPSPLCCQLSHLVPERHQQRSPAKKPWHSPHCFPPILWLTFYCFRQAHKNIEPTLCHLLLVQGMWQVLLQIVLHQIS